MSAPRVISLLPSCTESVCAIGLSELLVGRSHECDYPPEISGLPACTSARIDSSAPSAGINSEIKDFLSRGLSVFSVDAGQLRALQPDVILTQAQCEVCAASVSDLEEALEEWTFKRPVVLSVSPSRLLDVWQNIIDIGAAIGGEDRARDLVRRLKERVVDVIEKSCVIKNRPRVACIEWLDPLMAAGNWVPELVDMAGGLNLLGQPGKHSPWIDWAALSDANPERIIVMPCGFDLERTLRAMEGLKENREWSRLRAVRKGQVFATDGNSHFNRPGPRLVESLEILAEILHPNLFNFGHKEQGWIRLP